MTTPNSATSHPLLGQGALITGGGSGIGLASARALLAMGASVTLAGRSAERVQAAAAELSVDAPSGATVRWVSCDTADEDQVAAATEVAAEATGSVQLALAAAATG